MKPFNLKDSIMSMTEFGALPAVRITTPEGAEAIVTLYGGHVVSWKTADGRQRLFCSRLSALDGSRAIRGGVPLIFPQFGERGSGMRHGFARVANWRLLDSGVDEAGNYARFCIMDTDLAPQLAAAWPYKFELGLRVTLSGDSLALDFSVRNNGSVTFPFSAALHSYHQVGDLQAATLLGLHGVHFSDLDNADVVQQETVLAFSDKLDRIYYQAPARLALQDGELALQLEQHGFADTVVWNPGAADAQALSDMADDEYRQFVCIEAAMIAPLKLPPGESWSGRQVLAW